MHGMRLNDHSSPLAAFSKPTFRTEQCRSRWPSETSRLAADPYTGTIQQTPEV